MYCLLLGNKNINIDFIICTIKILHIILESISLKSRIILRVLLLDWNGLLLPLLNLLQLEDGHDNLQHQVVPCVDDAPNLRCHNPNNADPPNSDEEKDATENVSNNAADDGRFNHPDDFPHPVQSQL